MNFLEQRCMKNNNQRRRLSFNQISRNQSYKQGRRSQLEFNPHLSKYCANHHTKKALFVLSNSQLYCQLCAIKLASKGQHIQPIQNDYSKIRPYKNQDILMKNYQNITKSSSQQNNNQYFAKQSVNLTSKENKITDSDAHNYYYQIFISKQNQIKAQMEIYNKLVQCIIQKLRDLQIQHLMQFNAILEHNKRQFERGLDSFEDISYSNFLNQKGLVQIFQETCAFTMQMQNNGLRQDLSVFSQKILQKSKSSMKTKANTIETGNCISDNNFSQRNGVSFQNSFISVGSKDSQKDSKLKSFGNQELLARQKRSVVLRKVPLQSYRNGQSALSVSTKIATISKNNSNINQQNIKTIMQTKDRTLQDTPQSLKSQISATQNRIRAPQKVQMFDKIDVCESIDSFENLRAQLSFKNRQEKKEEISAYLPTIPTFLPKKTQFHLSPYSLS